MQGCSLHLRYNNVLQAPMQHRPFWMSGGQAGAKATPEKVWTTGIFQHCDIFAHARHNADRTSCSTLLVPSIRGKHHSLTSLLQIIGNMLVCPVSALV